MIKIYIYRTPYVQTQTGTHRSSKRQKNTPSNELSIHRSRRRSKSVIRDLILANQFDYFCTFTFSPDKVNRYDVSACKAKMSNWLHRQRRHSPKLSYLIVPEFHEDKKAIHFHALLANYNGTMKLTNKKNKGRKVYNLPGYRSGFSTAVPIDYATPSPHAPTPPSSPPAPLPVGSPAPQRTKKTSPLPTYATPPAVANYVTKYVTKDMPLLDGRKRYWRSKNLIMPKTTQNANITKYLKQLLTTKTYERHEYEVFEMPNV